jgi:hypothetical protein
MGQSQDFHLPWGGHRVDMSLDSPQTEGAGECQATPCPQTVVWQRPRLPRDSCLTTAERLDREHARGEAKTLSSVGIDPWPVRKLATRAYNWGCFDCYRRLVSVIVIHNMMVVKWCYVLIVNECQKCASQIMPKSLPGWKLKYCQVFLK